MHRKNNEDVPSFRAGLVNQIRAIEAMMVRDMMMRYGRANIGFVWLILESLILCSLVMILWSHIKAPFEHGIWIVNIVLTGYMPLTLWRHVSNSGPFLFRRCVPLLFHRRLSLIDSLAANALLELAGTTTALVVVYSTLAISGVVKPMQDPGLCAYAWFAMFVLASGMMCLFAVLTSKSEAFERFIQPLQYIFLPISGVFFMVEWLPSYAQEIAWYNPTVHIYEMFRAGFFGDDVITHYTPWYPMLCGSILIVISLYFLESVRDNISLD